MSTIWAFDWSAGVRLPQRNKAGLAYGSDGMARKIQYSPPSA